MRTSIRILAALSCAVLSACASNAAQRDADRLALYRNHAGAPVDSIAYLGGYNGWTPLGDGAFALWTRPSQAYLVELFAPCSELDFAETIAFRNLGGRLSAKFDHVYVSNRGLLPISCTIREIRPLDVKAIRLAEKDARAKRQVEGEPPAPAVPSGGPSAGT